jgi:hypothetical protein
MLREDADFSPGVYAYVWGIHFMHYVSVRRALEYEYGVITIDGIWRAILACICLREDGVARRVVVCRFVTKCECACFRTRWRR